MNSNYGKSNMKSGSMNNFDLDFGLGAGRSRSLNDQKNQASSAQSKPYAAASWTHQSNNNKASWTHQPAGSLTGPSSLVGDIFGRSWGSSLPTNVANVSSSTVGVVNKDPNLFGDLVNSALGQNKGGSNVPLKSSASSLNKSSFSMGGMADSLPKSSSMKSSGLWGSNQSSESSNRGGGSFNTTISSGNMNASGANIKSSGVGGPLMGSSTVGGIGGIGSKKDPFSTLVDFRSKPTASMSSGSRVDDDVFGDFQNVSKSGSSFSSSTFPTSNTASAPSRTSHPKVDDFGFTNTQSQPYAQPPSGGVDLDSLFQSSTKSVEGPVGESQQFSGGDDWGFEPEFGGNDNGGTTELEGLPPPPAGLSASTAKSKGMDNYKQGQFADAIKWLSWAFILLQNSGDVAGSAAEEVLSCRASCYKEVGEYKKAVADCTKVLEHDETNVAILVQRALLYENMEKYKLGAEDLRTVMKLDPGNRLARSTIHRMAKMADTY
ncbi:unnamed protein product [Cuscuta epithymum]|uniref:Uncharacterized protein n=1 Tax=Cuscuta epithymum TaxID=186058 RepID=A0AAV0C2G9_9ASTE|nr:unnamed protein product [Cuscuta epithymum]